MSNKIYAVPVVLKGNHYNSNQNFLHHQMLAQANCPAS